MSGGKMEIEIKVEKVEEQDIKEDIDSDEKEKPVAAVIKKKKKK